MYGRFSPQVAFAEVVNAQGHSRGLSGVDDEWLLGGGRRAERNRHG